MIKVPKSNHPIFSNSQFIDQICQEIRKTLKIEVFGYGKFEDNGNCIILSNKPKLYECLFKHEFIITTPIEYSILDSSEIYYDIPTEGYYQEIYKTFNMTHGFDIIKRKSDHYEMFFFSSHDDKLDHNFYFNNIEKLEKFIVFFKNSIAKLIKNYYSQKILLPEKMRTNFGGINKVVRDSYYDSILDENHLSCIKKTPLNYSSKRYQLLEDRVNTEIPLQSNGYFSSNNKFVYIINSSKKTISLQQARVLKYLLLGKTANSISKQLTLSKRTIESYINDLKLKLDCFSKEELIYTAWKLGLSHLALVDTL